MVYFSYDTMKDRTADNSIYVILHNIRSVHNVGSIFRTTEAVGANKIYCTGYTPTPIDRFSRKRDDFAKVALGAEEQMDWEAHDNVEVLISSLEEEGVNVIAAETTDNAIDYRDVRQGGDMAVVFGNEVDGVPQAVLDAVDTVASIPMYGHKSSLNVSVAAGILLFSLRDN